MRRGFVVHHDQDDHPVYTRDLSHVRCVAFWTAVKRYHMQTKGWSDIAYTAGVCRHGDVFAGRGWDQPQFAGGADQIADGFTYRDSDWYSVLAFIGHGEIPTAEMLAGLTTLIGEGRRTGRCGLGVIPHNRFRIKACPGPELTAWCGKWDGREFALSTLEEDMPLTEDDIARIWNYAVGTVKDPGAPAKSVLSWLKDEIDGNGNSAFEDRIANVVAAKVMVTVNSTSSVSLDAVKAAVKAALKEGVG